jgi:hypothetical protein
MPSLSEIAQPNPKSKMIGTNPALVPPKFLVICYNTLWDHFSNRGGFYLTDGCGNAVRDYTYYEQYNGTAPTYHFKTWEKALSFIKKVPPHEWETTDEKPVCPQAPEQADNAVE